MTTALGADGVATLGRVLDVIEAERDGTTGFLRGFLEGLSEHITQMIDGDPSRGRFG